MAARAPERAVHDAAQILRSPLRLPQFRNTNPYTGTGAMTVEQVKAFEAQRAEYRVRLAAWMDTNGVDAVVFPGQLSDIHLNDSIQPSFGRRDPQASAAGVPNVIFPAGVNDHGQPINLQLQGKAFDDLKLMGFAYAFEAKATGRVAPPTDVTPVLPFATPRPARWAAPSRPRCRSRWAVRRRSARSRRASRRSTRRRPRPTSSPPPVTRR